MKHPDARIEALLGQLASPKLATIDLSLARVTALLAALGNPQDRLPPVVHVAGTNGKGSLVAYLTAMLQAAGYRVHRYTSPYLIRVNENILLANETIDDAFLFELLEHVSSYVDRHSVTYFEALTAAAFLAFAQTPGDIVLLETGLGGRLDATNMVRTPLATAITPISMDHMEYLGDTITQIAGEKAGIIKRDVPCIVGPQGKEAAGVIEQKAKLLDAPLERYGREWQVKESEEGFHYHSAKRDTDFPFPNLVGHHQINNAATSVAVADCLDGFALTPAHITAGITHAVWPARLQRLTKGPIAKLVPDSAELWLDGGHNPGAGEALAGWVKTQNKPVHLVCGMLKNKDTKHFLMPLAPDVKSLVAIPIDDQPLALHPQAISEVANALGIQSTFKNGIKDAIKHIVKKEKNDFSILICGSLYLAGNILWQNSKSA